MAGEGSVVADGRLVRLFCRWGVSGCVGMPRGSDFDKRGLTDLLRRQHKVLAREQAFGCVRLPRGFCVGGRSGTRSRRGPWPIPRIGWGRPLPQLRTLPAR